MKNWEERFDEKYPSLSVWDDEDIADEVKDFIRRLLEEQAKYIVEELTSINSGDRMDTYEYKDRINALIKELHISK